ncbi:alpha-ketoacid dehydrogenase subunit beta [Methylocapsa palsarum]|uniref:Pyruvate dehydrogenase E1 component beta subunit n=1 Tax=Methylocapsa palsarum TaxID=1612308 RepID=A0A1I3YUE4_9HYPH|nr:transketolase C-terminal domain-containing protein [Methylocapsa palsarum]SFK35458.1 pyruvate dehydrogenase E1 component beta subunit [Methylocapsa palsarum]
MSREPQTRVVKLFFREAIARALREEMARDERIVILGQDVGSFGGSYKEFLGLYKQFGAARVRDTPVAEASMVGVGAGAAAAGLRPIVSITYMDFLMLGLDPLVNYAAKARYKTGGQLRVPLIVKTTAGAKGQGVAHSQCLEAWLMSVPGLKVVAPSTPADAYGLMKSALRESGPVVYVDHKRLFPMAGEMPEDEQITPFGLAKYLRRGADVTIATYSHMTQVALAAAEALAAEGVSCEIIDLRSLAPLDLATVCDSAGRTGALLTLEEGQIVCGVGAEIAFRVREKLGGAVRIDRVGALAAPVSSNPVLEAACVPDSARVARAIRGLLAA